MRLADNYFKIYKNKKINYIEYLIKRIVQLLIIILRNIIMLNLMKNIYGMMGRIFFFFFFLHSSFYIRLWVATKPSSKSFYCVLFNESETGCFVDTGITCINKFYHKEFPLWPSTSSLTPAVICRSCFKKFKIAF